MVIAETFRDSKKTISPDFEDLFMPLRRSHNKLVAKCRVGRNRYQVLDIIDTEISLKNIDTCKKYQLFRSLSILST